MNVLPDFWMELFLFSSIALTFFIIGRVYEREQKLKILRAKKMTPEQVVNTLTAVLPILIVAGAIGMLAKKKTKVRK